MKIAGWAVGLIGGWGIMTLFLAGLWAMPSPGMSNGSPMLMGVIAVAPYTAGLMLAIACIVAGSAIYDKKQE